MTTSTSIEEQIKKIQEDDSPNPSSSSSNSDGNTSSIKDKCMKIIQPPFVYFIVLFFLITGGLYYNKPCFVLSIEVDPKTNTQKIDFKMLGMYSIVITTLISFAIYPYISKNKKD